MHLNDFDKLITMSGVEKDGKFAVFNTTYTSVPNDVIHSLFSDCNVIGDKEYFMLDLTSIHNERPYKELRFLSQVFVGVVNAKDGTFK